MEQQVTFAQGGCPSRVEVFKRLCAGVQIGFAGAVEQDNRKRGLLQLSHDPMFLQIVETELNLLRPRKVLSVVKIEPVMAQGLSCS